METMSAPVMLLENGELYCLFRYLLRKEEVEAEAAEEEAAEEEEEEEEEE